ncbi:hypothetical protein BJ165DRAFT_1486798 [Panaeolus papilionaceus]|nr:hypothetical protein BJ165DRAFT_1486798 [Panaeolus papilionaceus]
MQKYEYLRVSGEVTITPCGPELVGKSGNYILIMGPTGSGKSSFVEALAGGHKSLGISKDQLSGYTQEVSAYKVENAAYVFGALGGKVPCYLLDTPGFSDSKIPELEILQKAKEWMRVHKLRAIDHILFLCPITDTRVPGSKRRTIKMMQVLLGMAAADECTIVTTMWNGLNSARARERAEAHFAQLRDEIWKDFTDHGARVVKFENNQLSALQILDDATSKSINLVFHRQTITASADAAVFLYQELLDRIEGAKRTKQLGRVEKLQLYAEPHEELESLMDQQIKEAEADIDKFITQLVEFGSAPSGFEGMPQNAITQHLQDRVNEAQEDEHAIEAALRHLLTEGNVEREMALTAQLDEVRLRLGESLKKFEDYQNLPAASAPISLQERLDKGVRSFKNKFSWRSKR